MDAVTVIESTSAARAGRVKCVVWDLDCTLWDGILAEGDAVEPFPHVARLVRELDERGILQSVASKNDAEPALAALERFGLREYFLYPQIHWGPKSESMRAIASDLNIGIDTLAFIDDQAFERDEVASAHPQVLCIDSACSAGLGEMPELQPRFVTEESKLRRKMYLQDADRDEVERLFDGPTEDFLATLDMRFRIERAKEPDLQRLEELVARTNQLNTTGRIYSYEQLDAFRTSERHDFWTAALEDVYGTYGKIGLALVEKDEAVWTVRSFLMSCRVMSRGVGTVFLHWLINRARDHGVALRAEMIPNERNRMMYATYRFAGFSLIAKDDGVELLERRSDQAPGYPQYVRLLVEQGD